MFVKYRSLTNHYHQATIDRIEEDPRSRQPWVVEEKIHGANFSLIFEQGAQAIECATRNHILELDENFFGYTRLMPQFMKFRSIFEELGYHSVTVYGELFGGSYPHVDVEQTGKSKKVNADVWYHPEVQFKAFSIIYRHEQDSEWIEMCQREFWGFMSSYKLPHVTPIFVGEFANCLQKSNEFQTTVPYDYNLPPITDNICEGVVIRPLTPFNLGNGKTAIIKSKNPKFSEKKGKAKKKMVPFVATETFQLIVDDFAQYITVPRIKAVMSKLTPEEQGLKNLGRIMGLSIKDTFEEFVNDSPGALDDITHREKKYLTNMAQVDYRRELLKILE